MTPLEILEAHKVSAFAGGDTACSCDRTWRTNAEYRANVAEVLDEAMRERESQMRQLIRDMVDPDLCWFDHHGGCQAHGYLSLKPGELCPHMEAKQLLGGESSDGR